MTIVLAPKRSTESILYTVDLTQALAPAQDAISSFVLTVASGTITVPAANQTNDDTTVSFLAVGGTSSVTQTLTLTVTTVGAQVLVRSLSLLVSDTATSILPSTTTKGTIQDMAFEEITLAGFVFDVTSAEQASGLRRLDSLMRRWQSIGLDVGYNFPSAIGSSTRSDVSGVPDFCVDAVVVELALAIAPPIGKTLSAETRVRYQQSMTAVRAAYAVIPNRRLPNSTAFGAGAKPFSTWAPFVGSQGA